MPSNKPLTVEDEEQLENGGGVKDDTKRRRKKAYEDLDKYLEAKAELSITDLIEDKNNSDAREFFSKNLGQYFWSYQVKDEDGSDRSPRLGTAMKVRSLLKSEFIKRHGVDYTDQVLFPLDEKRWRSLTDRLGKEGLADTIHHEEIPADTIEALYELFANTVESLNARGSSKYSACLAKIPPAYHHKLHFLLQWCAQFILIMFEIRRGCENLRDLKQSDFETIDDKIWNFTCVKKVISEQDKNHRKGTNRQETGVIPLIDIAPNFNPGKLFLEYLKYLPEIKTNVGLVSKHGDYLFPRPKDCCKSFNVHDAKMMSLYQPNMPVGKNQISQMLPELCHALSKPKCTNHQIRVTAIKALRRAGYDWHTISKITGHKNPVNLVKHYDLSLEAPDLAAMATAIGAGPGIAKGDKFLPPNLDTREDRSQSLYCSSGSGRHVGLGDGEESSSSTFPEGSSSSSGRMVETSSSSARKVSSSSCGRKKLSSNSGKRDSSSISGRKESSSSSGSGVEWSFSNGRREGGITSSSFVEERNCPSSDRNDIKRLRVSKERFSYRDDVSEDVISLIGGDELNDISPMDSSSDDYKPNDKDDFVSSDEELDEVFPPKKKSGQDRLEKKMNEPRSVKRMRDNNSRGLFEKCKSVDNAEKEIVENKNVEKKSEPAIEPKSEDERRLNVSSIIPPHQIPDQALHDSGHWVGLARGLSDLALPLQSRLASTPSAISFPSNIVAIEGQRQENLQLVQLALQAQSMQAQLAQSMLAQSLEAQSQFFLKLQSQMAQASFGLDKVPQSQYNQQPQVTITQRVETVLTTSPKKS